MAGGGPGAARAAGLGRGEGRRVGAGGAGGGGLRRSEQGRSCLYRWRTATLESTGARGRAQLQGPSVTGRPALPRQMWHCLAVTT